MEGKIEEVCLHAIRMIERTNIVDKQGHVKIFADIFDIMYKFYMNMKMPEAGSRANTMWNDQKNKIMAVDPQKEEDYLLIIIKTLEIITEKIYHFRVDMTNQKLDEIRPVSFLNGRL